MKNWKFYLLIFAMMVACKKPYNPTVIDSPKSYLIVEGVINTNDTTTIKISRTVKLSSKTTDNPVEANINVESDNGESYSLNESAPGVYKMDGVFLDASHKYRLHITTSDNDNEYLSDYIPVKDSPPIDSIGFNLTAKGIQIYSNAHDVTKGTRYYRFDYTETWEFHSLYPSEWISNGSAIVPRPSDQRIYLCYKSNSSSTILLGSTAKLTQDVLYQNPIIAIESTAEKIETKYSILLRQYALTADSYKFWETLRKNTEQLGSIFDAEPTQLAGNIHNIHDNTDIVIGYISAGTVSKKRIFITSEQLPASYKTVYPYQCMQDSLWYHNPHSYAGLENDVEDVLIPGIMIPITAFYEGGPSPAGFMGADPYCVDCTLRGSKKRPDFWK
ncbi:MAG TPA: DUF4249 domain-containing protein [Mucilaginibacter sp.]|nr:DUF4249 domain-containing protein [Mucilaginibacter sp.]